jgi:hypothetical protein
MYRLIKFVHLAAVTLWIGGAFSTALLILRVTRAGDRTLMASVIRRRLRSRDRGSGVRAHAALGLGMLAVLGVPPRSLWVQWGFAGILGHFVLGATLIRRATVELATARGGSPRDRRADRRGSSAAPHAERGVLLAAPLGGGRWL